MSASGLPGINLVVLLVYENLPNLLRHGKFAEGFTLPIPLAVIPDHCIHPVSAALWGLRFW
jgi:hypothetical protein